MLETTASRMRSQKRASSGFSFPSRVLGFNEPFTDTNASVAATTRRMGRRWKIPIMVSLFAV